MIEREVNAASKEVYKTFKDNVSSHYEKYMDEFYKKNKTAPKFYGLTHETDLYAIELNTNAYIDICLFYQDRVCKLLNKSEKLKALGYKFETEDYPGIFIRNAAAQAIKEAAEDTNDESIEESFGHRGFRDVKPLRDGKDGDKDDDKFTTRPDGSKWQNSIDLPDDNDGWVDSIKLDEAATESKTLKGVKIYIDGPSKKIDIAIKLCNKNWSRIVNEAAEDWFNRIDRCDDDGSLKKTYPTVSAVKSHMTLDTVRYSSEEKRNNPICGSMDLSFDVDPEIDPNHFYTLYVDFDKDSNIKFDSIFEG